MKLHRYVDHQRLHIVTKDVISLSISVLLLFRHYISHKITFGAPSSGGVLCSACGAFMFECKTEKRNSQYEHGQPMEQKSGLFCTCNSGVASCKSQHQCHFWRMNSVFEANRTGK